MVKTCTPVAWLFLLTPLVVSCETVQGLVATMGEVQDEVSTFVDEVKAEDDAANEQPGDQVEVVETVAPPGPPTRVFIEQSEEHWGLQCSHENPPFARPFLKYQWLADGRPFAQVVHGDPSMPVGYGRGSMPDPEVLKVRDVPESISRDARFSCVVTFSDQDEALENLLTLKPNPTKTFESDPVPFLELQESLE
ncbi:MAG: hypothetical protein QGG40_18015 [Myxococcota bacterium]|jgi:hypothetical protein|nr:hypothetical protein [Myxococcota bacterium]